MISRRKPEAGHTAVHSKKQQILQKKITVFEYCPLAPSAHATSTMKRDRLLAKRDALSIPRSSAATFPHYCAILSGLMFTSCVFSPSSAFSSFSLTSKVVSSKRARAYARGHKVNRGPDRVRFRVRKTPAGLRRTFRVRKPRWVKENFPRAQAPLG